MTMSGLLTIASLLLLVSSVPLDSTSDNGQVSGSPTTGTENPTAPVTVTVSHTVISSDIVTVESETLTIGPGDIIPNSGTGVTALPTYTAAVEGSSSSSNNRGAIAGGVIGAIAIAIVAAFLFFRFRKRKSPVQMQWRKGFAPKWQSFDAKDDNVPQQVHNNAYDDRPYDGSNSITPFSPLFIREKHRPSAADPFADPHISPSGGSTRGHHRNQSSFGSFGGNARYHDDSIEMMPAHEGSEERTVV